MIQSVRWIAFGISNSSTKTIVHFFPSEGGVSAPYPATCTLKIFGSKMQERKVVIEGARLSHPDGVRLEQAFPSLGEENIGNFGLEIEVATIQPRVDVSPSSCIIELVSKGYSTRYWPVRLAPVPTLLRPALDDDTTRGEGDESTDENERVLPLLRDSYGFPSFIGVNGMQEEYRPKVAFVGNSSAIPVSSVPGGGLSEGVCDDALFNAKAPKEASWGLIRMCALVTSERATSASRAIFLVYREPLSRRPVSVVSLVEGASL